MHWLFGRPRKKKVVSALMVLYTLMCIIIIMMMIRRSLPFPLIFTVLNCGALNFTFLPLLLFCCQTLVILLRSGAELYIFLFIEQMDGPGPVRTSFWYILFLLYIFSILFLLRFSFLYSTRSCWYILDLFRTFIALQDATLTFTFYHYFYLPIFCTLFTFALLPFLPTLSWFFLLLLFFLQLLLLLLYCCILLLFVVLVVVLVLLIDILYSVGVS